MNTVRIGVIGLGIGKRHLESYRNMPGVVIAAVADPDPARREECAERYAAAAWDNGEALLREAQVDAVSVCTPPSSHRSLTCLAASRGIHVLCEKPMAPTLADCDAMVAACREAGVLLMVAQKKRFHPFVQRLKHETEGRLGPIRWAVVKYALGRVPMQWFWDEADGGGPLQENSVHAVDTLRYLMGEVETVMAVGGNLFNPQHVPQVDTAAVSLRFQSGAVAALGLGQASEWAFADEHFFFACDGGEVHFSGRFDMPVHWWLAVRSPQAEPEVEELPGDDCFDREIAHFLQCVRTRTEPLVTGADARNSVAVTLAIKASIRSGQAVRLATPDS